MKPDCRILVIRLGAMGDVIHALPAVASLKSSFARCSVTWAIDSKWAPLLEGNPFVDEILTADRRKFSSLLALRSRLRARPWDFAVDFQGLLKSALVAFAARPDRIYGFDRTQVRERFAALFYSRTVKAEAKHVVDRNLELVQGAGAFSVVKRFPIPSGSAEGELPREPFLLASPFAGWPGKQWPVERYVELARLVELPLVLNVPPGAAIEARGARIHESGLAGLIDATRRAAAVAGVDSGPMHLAAALGKPGVAIFGPTDPERNGPYGSSVAVLRDKLAATTYKRTSAGSESMTRIAASDAARALRDKLVCA